MDNNCSTLVLGTVQLGMPYGIANTVGQPDQQTVNEIIRTAYEYGIREFDTAQGYGTSETVLGKAIRALKVSQPVKVITKLDLNLDYSNARVIFDALEASRTHLGVEKLHGVLLHREELIGLWEKGLGRILQDAVAQGIVDHVGVSVCTPSAALRVVEMEGVTSIQLPTNILDRRFEQTGVFELAQQRGIAVYIRSAFLQGLLLMDSGKLSDAMLFASPVLEQVEEVTRALGLTRPELALGYLKLAFPGAKILFGAETVEQVKFNCQGWKREYAPSIVRYIRETFSNVDERILNPSLWPR